MASKLELKFTGVSIVNETITLDGGAMSFTAKTTRTQSKTYTVATTIARQVVEFYNAFSLDVNREQDYTVTYNEDSITIEHPEASKLANYDDADNNTSNIEATLTVTADRAAVTFTTEFLPASSDFCNFVKVRVTYSENIQGLKLEQIIEGISTTTVYNNQSFNNNTVDVTLNRNAFILKLTATTVDGDVVGFKTTPKKMDITLAEAGDNGFGGYVEIDTNNFIGDELNQYAVTTDLNNITYQDSRFFSALTPNTYFAVVKDAYNCVRNVSFEVGQVVVDLPPVPKMLIVPLKNSIPFFSRTLPTNSLVSNNFNFTYRELPHLVNNVDSDIVFAKSQKTTIQFKSSYSVNDVRLVTCDDSIGLEAVKMTDQIQRNTFLEGVTTYNAWYGKLAVSFVGGDVYDSNGNVIGQHDYNGVLPNYYQIGTPIKVQGIASQIVAIVEENGIEYAITGIGLNNPQNSNVIETIHIALAYENYEFEIDFNDINSKSFYLTITGQDGDTSIQPANVWQSPNINILSDEDFKARKFHVVEYWSDANDEEINYNTGIRHLRNLEYDAPLLPQSVGEVDTQKLDNKYLKLNGTIGSVFSTQLRAFPTMYGLSLLKVLDTSDYIVWDNMECTTTQASEIEHKGELCTVKATIGVYNIIIETGQDFSLTGYYPVVP